MCTVYLSGLDTAFGLGTLLYGKINRSPPIRYDPLNTSEANITDNNTNGYFAMIQKIIPLLCILQICAKSEDCWRTKFSTRMHFKGWRDYIGPNGRVDWPQRNSKRFTAWMGYPQTLVGVRSLNGPRRLLKNMWSEEEFPPDEQYWETARKPLPPGHRRPPCRNRQKHCNDNTASVEHAQMNQG